MTQKIKESEFITQKELAERWHISESCVKNYRDKGILPYFRIPGSSRILYPVNGIKNIEAKHTTPAKEVARRDPSTEITRKKPGISATTKEWRI